MTLVTPWKGCFSLPVTLSLWDCQHRRTKTTGECYTIHGPARAKPDSGPLAPQKPEMTQGEKEREEQIRSNPHQIMPAHKIRAWSLPCKTPTQFLRTATSFATLESPCCYWAMGCKTALFRLKIQKRIAVVPIHTHYLFSCIRCHQEKPARSIFCKRFHRSISTNNTTNK